MNKENKPTIVFRVICALTAVAVILFGILCIKTNAEEKPLSEIKVSVNEVAVADYMATLNQSWVEYENAFWITQYAVDNGITLEWYGIRVDMTSEINPDTGKYDFMLAVYEHATFDRDFPMYPTQETILTKVGNYAPATNTALRPWYGSYTDDFIDSFANLLIADAPNVDETEAYQKGVADIFSQQYNDLKDAIDNGGNIGQGAIQGFLAGLTGFASTILNGITIGGVTLLSFVATACFILIAVFIIKAVKK